MPQGTPEELYQQLKKNQVTRVVAASPKMFGTTIHRYLTEVQKAYPDRLAIIKKEGEQEPALLVRVD
ncbi:MAG: hypothetical protein HC842_02105 [Cytophagales bacterium]|nr:hypothetical protein [Cytophagales bacterium]